MPPHNCGKECGGREDKGQRYDEKLGHGVQAKIAPGIDAPRAAWLGSERPGADLIRFGAAIALAANAIWSTSHYATGVYAAAVTLNLIGGATFFLFSLIFLFAKPIESVTPAPKD